MVPALGVEPSSISLVRGAPSPRRLDGHNLVHLVGYDPTSPTFQAGAVTRSAEGAFEFGVDGKSRTCFPGFTVQDNHRYTTSTDASRSCTFRPHGLIRMAAPQRIELCYPGSEPERRTNGEASRLERDTGFEPVRTTWKDVMLPLHQSRMFGASSGDRTHDLLITNEVHYHCATEA